MFSGEVKLYSVYPNTSFQYEIYQKNKQILKLAKNACWARQIVGIFALKSRREVDKLLIMKLKISYYLFMYKLAVFIA